MLVNQLPQIMEQKGVSIRRLSKMTGITYTTIWAMYHSQRRSIQLDVFAAVCEVLQIQPGDIYQYEPGRQQPAGDKRLIEAEVRPTTPQGPYNVRQMSGPADKTDPQSDWRAW